MKIIKHAQSCLEVLTRKANFLIDPGSYVFEDEGKTVEDFAHIDAIIITHAHYDHFDEKSILQMCEKFNIRLFAPEDVLKNIKCPDQIVVHDGDGMNFKQVKLDFFKSKHGPLPNGNPAPEVLGVRIDDGENSIYSPGDSIFLNEKAKADVIAVPISGTVTMNIDEAVDQIEKLSPKYAIPMHYDNPAYPADSNVFVEKMSSSAIRVKALRWGEYITL